MNDCTLCIELASGRRSFWNQPMVETENFVVLPSLGSLVEGWVLIVPKRHVLSMGALSVELRPEADQLEAQLRDLLEERYQKPVLVFEHGPSAPKHGTGCGVDHAHLHLVPLKCDLQRYVSPFLPPEQEWTEANWEQRETAYRCGLDYLYLKQHGASGLIAVSQDFGSQVFRKAIADSLGRTEQFNWRSNPQLETVSCTIKSFQSDLKDFAA